MTLLLDTEVLQAHAFGARYDLPLPLALYLWAAGATVALSFVIAGFLLRPRRPDRRWQRDLAGTRVGRLLTSSATLRALQTVSMLLLMLVVAAGFAGSDSPTANFATVFVWVIWWVGMTYLTVLFGNLWDAVNPWRALSAALARLPVPAVPPLSRFADSLGVWPALVLFAAFCHLEFISDAGEQPDILAGLIVAYTLIMLAGSVLVGPRWYTHADAFTVLFGILARFGVFHGSVTPERRLVVRPPGAGLLAREPVPLSVMAFVILALTTVTFDGFVETPAWAAIIDRVAESRLLRSPLVSLQEQDWDLLELVKTVALLAGYVLFVVVYLAVCLLVARWSGREDGALETARAHVLSLVPIAIAYHLAHYLSYLLVAGQLVIPLVSDPFGLGWDLFGTAGYRIDITVIGARQVWYLSVIAIVAGHVIAVLLAHATALHRAASGRHAIVGQFPMVALMVGYTMISLWILSQPIVDTG